MGQEGMGGWGVGGQEGMGMWGGVFTMTSLKDILSGLKDACIKNLCCLWANKNQSSARCKKWVISSVFVFVGWWGSWGPCWCSCICVISMTGTDYHLD